MSSRNSSQNFDLRCDVREKMTAFLQQNYPDAFPRTRFAAISQLGNPTPTPMAPMTAPAGANTAPSPKKPHR